jgi:hypothetical protein
LRLLAIPVGGPGRGLAAAAPLDSGTRAQHIHRFHMRPGRYRRGGLSQRGHSGLQSSSPASRLLCGEVVLEHALDPRVQGVPGRALAGRSGGLKGPQSEEVRQRRYSWAGREKRVAVDHVHVVAWEQFEDPFQLVGIVAAVGIGGAGA